MRSGDTSQTLHAGHTMFLELWDRQNQAKSGFTFVDKKKRPPYRPIDTLSQPEITYRPC